MKEDISVGKSGQNVEHPAGNQALFSIGSLQAGSAIAPDRTPAAGVV